MGLAPLIVTVAALDPLVAHSSATGTRCSPASASAAKVAEHAAAALRTAMGDVPGLPSGDAATVVLSRAPTAACDQSTISRLHTSSSANVQVEEDSVTGAEAIHTKVGAQGTSRATYVSVLVDKNGTGNDNDWMLMELIEARRPQQFVPSDLGHLFS